MVSGNIFQPTSRIRLADELVEQIKARILSGVLAVGDRLPSERELAKVFNTSPVVLREALHTLEAAGLVTIRKGATGGAFISRPTHRVLSQSLSTLFRFGQTTLAELTEARLVLEPEVAALAALRRTEAHLGMLRANMERSEDCCHSLIERRVETLNFHRLLAEITGNPFLIASVNSITDNFVDNTGTTGITEKVVTRNVDDHQRIIDAVVRQNQDEARELMRLHIEQIQASLTRSS
jgi:DNA-binding FadR family transcriptional regulator